MCTCVILTTWPEQPNVFQVLVSLRMICLLLVPGTGNEYEKAL